MSFSSRLAAPFRTRWQAGLVLVLATWLLLLAIELANHRFRMVDFEVFHTAGERFVAAENLYRHGEAGDGFYEWKYSPPAAALFVPFALLPLFTAKIVWWMLVALVAAWNLRTALALALPGYRTDPARANRVVLACALATAVHVHLELHLGQVNQVILGLFLLAILAVVERRALLFGSAAAASLVLKPFALVLVPWLVLRRRWRELGAFAGATGAFFCLAWARYGTGGLAGQLSGWRFALGEELAKKTALQAPANHTLASLAARYTPLGLLELSPGAGRAVQLATLAALGLFVLWFMARGRAQTGAAAPGREVAELALLVALVPLIAFTNYNAFGAVLPAATLLVAGFGALPRPARWATVAGLVLVGGNVHDLWGKRTFALLEGLSLVAVGAVLLVGALAAGRARRVF